MKRFVIAAALGSFTCIVHAQSSVTLYGVADAGFVYNNNSKGHPLYTTGAGNLQGNRWGLRGAEDIGGGLKAVFVLENGFNMYTGGLAQGGDLFGRQAYVGISSDYGSLTLGRQYDSVVDFTGPFEVGTQWATYFGAHPGDLDNMNNTNRINNSVKYTSANYAGLKFGALYSFGGVAGQFSKNQIFSGGIGYSHGPLALGVAYLNVKNPNFSLYGNMAASSASGSNMGGSTVISGYATAGSEQVISAGGSYTLGSATLGATYSNTQFRNLGQTPVIAAGQVTAGTAKFHNVELNLKYQITPVWLVGAAYDYTRGYGVNDARYNQVVVGTDYFLSKRTDLYLDCVYQHASGTDSTGHMAVANINALSASSTASQVATIVGIRHRF
ncbi:Outer membrane protein (Porin) [Paraburkholderia unamae]|uniref:porin n=1 Tax=Paraburkholderia unamae TaxID=219649 RepID=UPI001CB14E85|nr:porin [Paraburkholderia unamae]CAG9246039.1 Outer membrane protein (Porin) [Paraburkholderia unamae]